MKIKNNLNIALLIIGISIVILGAVLFFTVPAELKENFTEMHANSYAVKNGEWGFRSGRDVFPGRFDHPINRSHRGFWLLPLLIIILIPLFILRRKTSYNYFGHKKYGYMKHPIDILRNSYAKGRMSKEEYLERKKILEQEEEILK